MWKLMVNVSERHFSLHFFPKPTTEASLGTCSNMFALVECFLLTECEDEQLLKKFHPDIYKRLVMWIGIYQTIPKLCNYLINDFWFVFVFALLKLTKASACAVGEHSWELTRGYNKRIRLGCLTIVQVWESWLFSVAQDCRLLKGWPSYLLDIVFKWVVSLIVILVLLLERFRKAIKLWHLAID